MAKFGGAQANAGRKKGSLNVKSQELIAQAIKQGITPIEVLLNDMRFFYSLGERKMDEAASTPPGKEQAKAFRAACELKQLARECANDAAPFVHPKLAAISAPDGGPIQLSLEVTFVSPQN